MPELDRVIRGIDAVLPAGRHQVDIGIDETGQIGAIAIAGTLKAQAVVEGAGLIALPGGVDLHVHIHTYFDGTTTRDDFYSGTAAALLGGTTTIGQFALPLPGETTIAAVARTLEEARAQAVADYAVHGALVRETYDASAPELARLVSKGVRTLKVFTAYTDAIGLSIGQIHAILADAAQFGLTVFVHAETDSLVREGIANAVANVGTGPRAHAISRTPLAESDAIRSICDLADDAGARVYFVHISSAQGAAAIAEQRVKGRRLFAETCPHYLFLDEALYDGPGGERWICSPPIRSSDDRAALWDALRGGVIDTVSSDHNCYDTTQKRTSPDFRQIPNGLPGIGYRLPLLIDAALRGRISWGRLVEVASEAPARVLGLSPRKGAITIGSDADIVLVDPGSETDLSAAHMASDYSPYEGVRTAGKIVQVYRRGELAVETGSLRAARGTGRFLPQPAAPGQRSLSA